MKASSEIPQNYRSLLREILIEKQKKNPRFSLRKFAQQMGMQSSLLSMVLSGKRRLSRESSELIIEKLKFDDQQAKLFSLLVSLEEAKSVLTRERVLKEIHSLGETDKSAIRDLSVDQFRVISEWYHLPIFLMIDLDGFDWSEDKAARVLSISTQEVRQALERLTVLELIYWKGNRAYRNEEWLKTGSEFHHEAIKAFTLQMLEKTMLAIKEKDPKERFTGTLTLALNEDQTAEAHQILNETMRKLSKLALNRSKKAKQVYHANLNLFSLFKPLLNQKGETP